MLFVVTWKEKFTSEDQEKRGLQLLSNWEPPEGVEFKGFYARADQGGFAIVEADTADNLMRTTAPWGVYLDFDLSPIVEMELASNIFGEALGWRDSIS